jgi:hypothetical protein
MVVFIWIKSNLDELIQAIFLTIQQTIHWVSIRTNVHMADEYQRESNSFKYKISMTVRISYIRAYVWRVHNINENKVRENMQHNLATYFEFCILLSYILIPSYLYATSTLLNVCNYVPSLSTKLQSTQIEWNETKFCRSFEHLFGRK